MLFNYFLLIAFCILFIYYICGIAMLGVEISYLFLKRFKQSNTITAIAFIFTMVFVFIVVIFTASTLEQIGLLPLLQKIAVDSMSLFTKGV